MQDLNAGTLVCRLAKDPELRTTKSGTSVTTLRVAFTTTFKDDGGQWTDKSNFIDVIVWGRQAESLCQNLTRGQRIGVTYRLEVREFEHNGQNRSVVELVADRVQYLDPKADRDGPARTNSSRPASAPAAPPQNDDIPF